MSQRDAVGANALQSYGMLIGGQWVPATNAREMVSLNPYTGQPWAAVPDAGPEDVALAIASARRAFDEGPWGRTTARERSVLLRRLGDLIAQNCENLAQIESRDNGKLLKEMRAQWRYIPEWFYYYAGVAELIEGSTLPSDRPNYFVFTRKEAVGVVGAITPWNSPGLLLTWKLAPALAAGCTFVVKPSEHTPVSTLELGKLFDEAGFPPGVFNVITGGAGAGRALVGDPRLDKIAFTGSTDVGKSIARAASENLTGVLLELGGKSPNIVFEDADPAAAANGIIAGIFAATGQSCMAGSRLLIQRSIMGEVLTRVVERAKDIRLGDPSLESTEMGPVATRQQHEKVLAMIDAAKQDGAKVVCGGRDEHLQGLFVRPTIISDVSPEMAIVRDEVFGPVLTVLPFDTEEEAVSLANRTCFGLAAGVWTSNVQRAHRVSSRIRAGTIWVNAYRVVSYNAPFGGYKDSGLGRENGRAAVDEYLETKTVWIETSGNLRDPFSIG